MRELVTHSKCRLPTNPSMLCPVPGKTVLVTVSSSGPAAVSQVSPLMGVFIMTAQLYNSHPVYNKTGGGAVIFVRHTGDWSIKDTLHPTVAGIYHPQRQPTPSFPPTSGWRYYDGTGWKDDDSLTVVPRGRVGHM